MSAVAGAPKRPRNRGRALGQKSPFSTEEAAFIRERLKAEAATASAAIADFVRRGREGRLTPPKLLRRRLTALRDLALFNTAVDTMLRCSDILALRTEDVLSRSGAIFDEIPIQQQKTRRSVVVVLLPETRASLLAWIGGAEKRPGDPLFTSVANRNFGGPLTRVQYGNIVKDWAELVGATRGVTQRIPCAAPKHLSSIGKRETCGRVSCSSVM